MCVKVFNTFWDNFCIHIIIIIIIIIIIQNPDLYFPINENENKI